MTLQFVPFGSSLEPAFWHNLTQYKLNEWKLGTEAVPVFGFYSTTSRIEGVPPPLRLDFSAFLPDATPPPDHFAAHGLLKNFNTIEEFKNFDKVTWTRERAEETLWKPMGDGRVFADPSLLNQFVVVAYADLKRYNYFYWFGFLAFSSPQDTVVLDEPLCLGNSWSSGRLRKLAVAYDAFAASAEKAPFFVMRSEAVGDEEIIEVKRLSADFLEMIEAHPSSNFTLGFCDPSNLARFPGWPLRNLLTLYALHFAKSRPSVEILCLRDFYADGKRDVSRSLHLSLKVSPLTNEGAPPPMPSVVGWEKNERGKSGPRSIDLSATMDPQRVAEAAVDLNLKLMRWRLVPELDLNTLSETRVLILGSGTLGCNVARGLLGWGIRNITFVDHGKVSFSNPVRQSLFTFEDCLDGGTWKSQAAAQGLRRIFPSIQASAVLLTIPMPGHFVSEATKDQMMANVAKLDDLIHEHDVVFLLTDTRESRWLPTLMANAQGKLVINAALGYDSFVVMRHGIKMLNPTPEVAGAEGDADQSQVFMKKIPGEKLGCYFCNDVVAPGDSTRDRTLDQQCTVTRPGVSMIASALAVELLVSVLQHPLRGRASAQTTPTEDDDYDYDDDRFADPSRPREPQSCLGIVPHQIRGFLSRHHQVLPSSLAFDRCTSCSDVVVRAFLGLESDDDDAWTRHRANVRADPDFRAPFSQLFLMRSFNETNFLEDLTGLTELHKESRNAEIWEFSDEEEI